MANPRKMLLTLACCVILIAVNSRATSATAKVPLQTKGWNDKTAPRSSFPQSTENFERGSVASSYNQRDWKTGTAPAASNARHSWTKTKTNFGNGNGRHRINTWPPRIGQQTQDYAEDFASQTPLDSASTDGDSRPLTSTTTADRTRQTFDNTESFTDTSEGLLPLDFGSTSSDVSASGQELGPGTTQTFAENLSQSQTPVDFGSTSTDIGISEGGGDQRLGQDRTQTVTEDVSNTDSTTDFGRTSSDTDLGTNDRQQQDLDTTQRVIGSTSDVGGVDNGQQFEYDTTQTFTGGDYEGQTLLDTESPGPSTVEDATFNGQTLEFDTSQMFVDDVSRQTPTDYRGLDTPAGDGTEQGTFDTTQGFTDDVSEGHSRTDFSNTQTDFYGTQTGTQQSEFDATQTYTGDVSTGTATEDFGSSTPDSDFRSQTPTRTDQPAPATDPTSFTATGDGDFDTVSSFGDFEGSSVGTEDPIEGLRRAVPGEPGVDYPILDEVPETSFRCQEQSYPAGIYGDVESDCQVFHICQQDGRNNSFLCPNGTIFNQMYFVCDWWYNFNCSDTFEYYDLNANLYQEMDDSMADRIMNEILGKDRFPTDLVSVEPTSDSGGFSTFGNADEFTFSGQDFGSSAFPDQEITDDRSTLSTSVDDASSTSRLGPEGVQPGFGTAGTEAFAQTDVSRPETTYDSTEQSTDDVQNRDSLQNTAFDYSSQSDEEEEEETPFYQTEDDRDQSTDRLSEQQGSLADGGTSLADDITSQTDFNEESYTDSEGSPASQTLDSQTGRHVTDVSSDDSGYRTFQQQTDTDYDFSSEFGNSGAPDLGDYSAGSQTGGTDEQTVSSFSTQAQTETFGLGTEGFTDGNSSFIDQQASQQDVTPEFQTTSDTFPSRDADTTLAQTNIDSDSFNDFSTTSGQQEYFQENISDDVFPESGRSARKEWTAETSGSKDRNLVEVHNYGTHGWQEGLVPAAQVNGRGQTEEHNNGQHSSNRHNIEGSVPVAEKTRQEIWNDRAISQIPDTSSYNPDDRPVQQSVHSDGHAPGYEDRQRHYAKTSSISSVGAAGQRQQSGFVQTREPQDYPSIPVPKPNEVAQPGSLEQNSLDEFDTGLKDNKHTANRNGQENAVTGISQPVPVQDLWKYSYQVHAQGQPTASGVYSPSQNNSQLRSAPYGTQHGVRFDPTVNDMQPMVRDYPQELLQYENPSSVREPLRQQNVNPQADRWRPVDSRRTHGGGNHGGEVIPHGQLGGNNPHGQLGGNNPHGQLGVNNPHGQGTFTSGTHRDTQDMLNDRQLNMQIYRIPLAFLPNGNGNDVPHGNMPAYRILIEQPLDTLERHHGKNFDDTVIRQVPSVRIPKEQQAMSPEKSSNDFTPEDTIRGNGYDPNSGENTGRRNTRVGKSMNEGSYSVNQNHIRGNSYPGNQHGDNAFIQSAHAEDGTNRYSVKPDSSALYTKTTRVNAEVQRGGVGNIAVYSADNRDGDRMTYGTVNTERQVPNGGIIYDTQISRDANRNNNKAGFGPNAGSFSSQINANFRHRHGNSEYSTYSDGRNGALVIVQPPGASGHASNFRGNSVNASGSKELRKKQGSYIHPQMRTMESVHRPISADETLMPTWYGSNSWIPIIPNAHERHQQHYK